MKKKIFMVLFYNKNFINLSHLIVLIHDFDWKRYYNERNNHVRSLSQKLFVRIKLKFLQ